MYGGGVKEGVGGRRGLGGGGRRGWGVVAPFNLSTTHLMAVERGEAKLRDNTKRNCSSSETLKRNIFVNENDS